MQAHFLTSRSGSFVHLNLSQREVKSVLELFFNILEEKKFLWAMARTVFSRSVQLR